MKNKKNICLYIFCFCINLVFIIFTSFFSFSFENVKCIYKIWILFNIFFIDFLRNIRSFYWIYSFFFLFWINPQFSLKMCFFLHNNRFFDSIFIFSFFFVHLFSTYISIREIRKTLEKKSSLKTMSFTSFYNGFIC